jgi:serralysin
VAAATTRWSAAPETTGSIGGSGVDNLTGGSSADTFVFLLGESSATSGQHDRITDFVSGADHIDLSGYDAISSTGSYDQFKFLATSAFSGTAGELNYSYNSDHRHHDCRAIPTATASPISRSISPAMFAISLSDVIGAYSVPIVDRRRWAIPALL